jgi:hypothetical protein
MNMIISFMLLRYTSPFMGLHCCRKLEPACTQISENQNFRVSTIRTSEMYFTSVILLKRSTRRPYQGPGRYFPASHSEDPSSIPDQFMGDLCSTR